MPALNLRVSAVYFLSSSLFALFTEVQRCSYSEYAIFRDVYFAELDNITTEYALKLAVVNFFFFPFSFLHNM